MPNLERYLVAAIVAIVLLILGLTIFGNLEPAPGSVEPGANAMATPLEPPGPRTGASPLDRGMGGPGAPGAATAGGDLAASPVSAGAGAPAARTASAAGYGAPSEPAALNASLHARDRALPRGIGNGSPIPHEARAGDTFASIAREYYGTAKLGREIRKMNEDLDPFDIAPGTRIYVPMLTRKDVVAILGPDEAAAVARAARGGAGVMPVGAGSGPAGPGAGGEGGQPSLLAEAAPAAPAGAVGAGGAAARGVVQAPPHSPAPGRPAPAAAPARSTPVPSTYEVKPGDTLSEISQKLYGTSKRWKEILKLNQDLFEDPREMQAGMKLKVPPAEPVGATGG